MGQSSDNVAGDILKDTINNQKKQANSKVIARLEFNVLTFTFLPPEPGTMLAEYLCFVRPVEVFFSDEFNHAGAADLNEIFLADYRKESWDGYRLSPRLQEHMSENGMRGAWIAAVTAGGDCIYEETSQV